MEYRIQEVRELIPIARKLILLAKSQKPEDSAAVLALHGELGAGKTTFMQTLARELGVNETIVSPTFVVMKKYETTHGAFKTLVHIDAYRIEDIDEMRPLRFREELGVKDAIIGIEWAEKIEKLLPPHTLHVSFIENANGRVVTINGNEKN